MSLQKVTPCAKTFITKYYLKVIEYSQSTKMNLQYLWDFEKRVYTFLFGVLLLSMFLKVLCLFIQYVDTVITSVQKSWLTLSKRHTVKHNIFSKRYLVMFQYNIFEIQRLLLLLYQICNCCISGTTHLIIQPKKITLKLF